MWIPARIEEDEQRLDGMAGRDGYELHQPSKETLPVLDPEQIVEEYPHGVEPEPPGHAQLGIDAPRIVGVGLKHLELIDRVRRDVVRADQSMLRPVPTVGTVHRPPSLACRAGPWRSGQRGGSGEYQRDLQSSSTLHDAVVASAMAVFRVANQAAILRVGNVIRRHSVRTRRVEPTEVVVAQGSRAALPEPICSWPTVDALPHGRCSHHAT